MLRRGPAAHVRAAFGKKLQRNVWTKAVDLRHVQTEHSVQDRLHIEGEAVVSLILNPESTGIFHRQLVPRAQGAQTRLDLCITVDDAL